ncbi:MAG: mCpol domain-containing protein [Bacteroidota bacterium]
MDEQEFYLGLDGDSIGRVIESYLITNKPDKLNEFSLSISNAISEISDIVRDNEGTVIFYGGDSILYKGALNKELGEKILKVFFERTGKTASIGIGKTTTESYLAMKLAKANGGNQVVVFDR